MRGGYRQGAGRKQGFAAKSAEETRRILSEMVMSEIKPIGKALIAKAKKGDVMAVRELFDRAWGKAPQVSKIDLTDERLPTPILVTFSQEAEDRYAHLQENVVTIDKTVAEKHGIQAIYGGAECALG
ncbi:hypothetical protein HYS79_01880 [Patescibacteria group bacterium]|nr:hypothetical protein [Patescibacteria group bacterium]